MQGYDSGGYGSSEKVETAYGVYKYVHACIDLIMTISIVAMFIIRATMRKTVAWPPAISISVALLCAMQVSIDAYDIVRLCYNLSYKDEFDGEHPWARLLDSFASLFFVSNCWFFASHYLSVACLFRLTFSASWLENKQKIKRRK